MDTAYIVCDVLSSSGVGISHRPNQRDCHRSALLQRRLITIARYVQEHYRPIRVLATLVPVVTPTVPGQTVEVHVIAEEVPSVLTRATISAIRWRPGRTVRDRRLPPAYEIGIL